MNKRIAWFSIIFISVIAISYLIFYRNNQSLITYTEPHCYSISYPRGWLKDGGGIQNGFEILALFSYDYHHLGNQGDGFGPGQIKIALSIVDKGRKSLEEVVQSELTGKEAELKKESLMINGNRAIRIKALFNSQEETGLSPMIKTYIEFKNNQYAMLVGYYDGDQNSVKIIDKIQQSFQVLK